MNRFIDVTPSRCIGCRTCEIACALTHSGAGTNADVAAGDASQGDVLACLGSAPRLKVIKTETACMPVTCHHCDDAPCAAACPTGAITHTQNTVQVNQDRCIGCKSCMIACPYGMIDVVTTAASRPFAGVRISTGMKARAQKCDLCIDRAQGPACVSSCPTQALWVANEDGIRDLMQKRQQEAMQKAVDAEVRA
jgi:electron transport protein HydN